MSTVKKHEYLKEDMYYESHSVGTKARSDKTCEHCGKSINKGVPHMNHKFYGEDGDWPTYPTHLTNPVHGDRPKPGEKSCSELFIESLN